VSGALPAILYAGLHQPLGSTRLALHARSYSAIRRTRVVYLRPQEWRLLALLAAAQGVGSPLYYDVLIEALWGDDEDGGPLSPVNVLTVTIHRLRKKTACLGISIETIWGRGLLLTDAAQVSAAKSLRLAA